MITRKWLGGSMQHYMANCIATEYFIFKFNNVNVSIIYYSLIYTNVILITCLALQICTVL